MSMTWVLEAEVFDDGGAFERAARTRGHRVVRWRDAWWGEGGAPVLEGPVVFRGSLDNARRVREELDWAPGAFCDVEAFRCSTYYPKARPWLLAESFEFSSVERLCAERDEVAHRLGARHLFVRPDSPLKPFSGRVLEASAVTPAALDCGFYYDDPALPIVVSAAREVSEEWRFVVSRGAIVARSGYDAEGRGARGDAIPAQVESRAASIADALEAPEAIYVLDLCRSEGELRLLELNPWSGADLYACDPGAVIDAVAALVSSTVREINRP